MKKLGSLFLILLWVANTDCTKKKPPKIFDPVWQEESLSLNSKFCAKLRECSQGEWEKLPPKLQAYASSRISDIECNTAHRKSNVFLLRGTNPEAIKTITRNCHADIQAISCESMRTSGLTQSPNCQKMEEILSAY